MKLRDLAPGTRFRLPECGKTGVLVRVGQMGARVLYDGSRRKVEFTVTETETGVSFESEGDPVIISDHSEVEVLPGG